MVVTLYSDLIDANGFVVNGTKKDILSHPSVKTDFLEDNGGKFDACYVDAV